MTRQWRHAFTSFETREHTLHGTVTGMESMRIMSTYEDQLDRLLVPFKDAKVREYNLHIAVAIHRLLSLSGRRLRMILSPFRYMCTSERLRWFHWTIRFLKQNCVQFVVAMCSVVSSKRCIRHSSVLPDSSRTRHNGAGTKPRTVCIYLTSCGLIQTFDRDVPYSPSFVDIWSERLNLENSYLILHQPPWEPLSDARAKLTVGVFECMFATLY
ncbi:hypothetical protein K503DRAFT_568038 [Rhizopogon vinicolor AM-OR11-026]|uniref:Uncharacterized protein n=1 Tax=Rhizopogon vinicolor AM-OR11-026 TaxID=1314800 RepID=A0A1B7N7P2_9AGAM|nr:hypothetical protein K503DRAFT_568038 [Rhizopogon vinicolor AM-OR11-026]